MFDCPISPTTRLHHFLFAEAESLQNAALLLGGRPWLRRVQELLDAAATQSRLTRCMEAELHQLCDLLHLEHVHDLDRPEAGYFAELDPAGPHVPEICRLSDGLAECLGQAEARLKVRFVMDEGYH